MPEFLANPEKVKGNKRSVLAAKGKALFTRQDATGKPVFTPASARLSAQCLLSLESATPVADESQKWWYSVTGNSWLPQSDVEEVSQYDLLKLGFQALEEDSDGDMMNSPYESWVPEAFGAISRSTEQGADYQYSQVPQFYRDLMAEMGSNRNGKVTAEEIRQAMAVRDENKAQCERALPYLNKYTKAYNMEDKKEVVHFLSQIGHESSFSITEEDLNYSAKGMRRIFGCIKGPAQYNKKTDGCNLGRLRDKLWTHESSYAHRLEH